MRKYHIVGFLLAKERAQIANARLHQSLLNHRLGIRQQTQYRLSYYVMKGIQLRLVAWSGHLIRSISLRLLQKVDSAFGQSSNIPGEGHANNHGT